MTSCTIQENFYHLVDHGTDQLKGDEILLLNLQSEASDFVRFNRSKVRQPGTVQQSVLSCRLIDGKKHCSIEQTLTGDADLDRAIVEQTIVDLRAKMEHIPEDPHLLFNTTPMSTEHSAGAQNFNSKEMVEDITAAAQGVDLVGILASGSIHRGFGNSLGQKNWFSTNNFNFDFSLVHSADKAVKSGYAGSKWESPEFSSVMNLAQRKLKALERPAIDLKPDLYDVFLSPVAVWEILGLLSWGGFSLQAQRSKSSTLLKLVAGEVGLDPRVSISENIAEGASPQFQAQGFLSPDSISLIDQGQHAGSLISPRTAKEYDIQTNGASAMETPSSLDMQGGDLKADSILEQLDTGIHVGNLWYLNYSDRIGCRMTGMTRFATFWVKDGEVVAPLNVLRFDDTVYNILGSNLKGLTKERQFLLSAGSYFQRSTASAHLPGVISKLRFTL